MRTVLKILVATMVFSILVVNFSFAAPLYIYSDSTWKSYGSEQTGWTTVGFDDSGWRDAYSPYPVPDSPNNWIPNTPSQFIWDWPNDNSDPVSGMDGPLEAWFRKDFYLAWEQSYISEAIITINADDRFDFYVNGETITTGFVGVEAGGPYEFDILPYLTSGDNVFAIHAWDGYDNGPHDRLYEWLLVETKIQPIPEPSTIFLMGVGLLGLAGMRKKFRKR